MALFDKLFGKTTNAAKNDEAVLIYLDGTSLPDEIYANYDLATLEDQLIDAINVHRVGEFDGNEIGDKETALFTYGPDANKLFAVIEPVLNAYPLCKNARVILRQGGPGSPQTEVKVQQPTNAGLASS